MIRQCDDVAALDARVRKSRVAVIGDAAHLPTMERPAKFNSVLREFLRTQ